MASEDNTVLCFAQVISLEGWTDIMYYVQDAHSFWDWIYFVLLIVVKSFILSVFPDIFEVTAHKFPPLGS